MGIIKLSEATAGFANEGMLTVMVLFAVAAGIEKTGCLEVVRHFLTFGLKKRLQAAADAHDQDVEKAEKDGKKKPAVPLAGILYRLIVPLGVLSAFLNNTPIVAMFIPILQDFSKRTGISPSKLMLPLSYGVILGGTCTLIGTSTNLVAFSLAEKARPKEINSSTFGLFTIAVVGLPVFLGGILYTTLLAQYLIPERIPAAESFNNPRDYIIVAKVLKDSAIDGKSIKKAKLRNLKGLFLSQIIRPDDADTQSISDIRPSDSRETLKDVIDIAEDIKGTSSESGSDVPGHTIISAPGPETVLRGGDHLWFAGRVDFIENLRNIPGLVIIEDKDAHIDFRNLKANNTLFEAVVGSRSPLVNKFIRDSNFRTSHNAAVIAVHRDGELVSPPDNKGLGQIILKSVTFSSSLDPQRSKRTLKKPPEHPRLRFRSYPSTSKDPTPRIIYRAILAAVLAMTAIMLATFNVMSLLTAMVFAAALMIVAGCLTADEARNALSWEVLLTVAISFGLGSAMQNSGAAELIANGLVKAAEPTGRIGLMTALYFVTVILNAILTNNAAVAVLFPIVDAACKSKGYEFTPFLIVLMLAGSADFSTPIGYQCNLMVYAPGGYKFRDYLVFGIPLQLITGFITIAVAANLALWWVWALVLGVANVVVVVGIEGLGVRVLGALKKKETA
ncbi:citrate transporter-domain-containing protein [Chytridium lagenaria]|nr:citrate transporter-domain-containing protein [Chytridium lagenaria]